MAHFAVIAIGADRPGIVAALTGALFEAGGNLEDVSSSILRGHFAIMLVVDARVPADELERDLTGAAGPLGVSVTNLEGGSMEQLDLFAARDVTDRLGPALDAITARFGKGAIRRAVDEPEKATATDRRKRGE